MSRFTQRAYQGAGQSGDWASTGQDAYLCPTTE